MESSMIWSIYLQLYNQELVGSDSHKIIIQDILIKLHFYHIISDEILIRGLKYIHLNYVQYLSNYHSIRKQIFNIKKVNSSFETNLIYSAIYSGGFYNEESMLFKMKFYLQARDPSLKKIDLGGISDSFSNIWLPLLNGQMNKYLAIYHYNLTNIPDFSKFFILSFIGYRHFPCGYPFLLKNTLFDYLFGKIFMEQIVFYISGKGNEAQMEAVLTFLHIIFPNDLIASQEESIFANMLNFSNSINPLYNELAANILTNCCKYSNKEFGMDLTCYKKDLFGFNIGQLIDVKPIEFSVNILSEPLKSEMKTSTPPKQDTNNIELELNQAIIENNQHNYNKVFECLDAQQMIDIEQHFINLAELAQTLSITLLKMIQSMNAIY